MGVSGVGSVYKYTYNPATGKLSASDGSQDDFVIILTENMMRRRLIP